MDVTFREWLYQFKNDDFRVGTLARYAYCGADFPDTREFDKVYHYLKFTAGAGPELIAGFKFAYDTYRHSTNVYIYLEK
ncbi:MULTISPECIES: YozE family protein [Planococcus]|uniref:YozE SAM-like protein n=1 Tax=Planococcus citreus TaxID=1373 RepID=A0A497YIR2_9BACL|nr:YozE family protein [Planococcus citreus]RLJ90105.1 YozE SAM-like protein [Planococcus citreus]